MVRAYQLALLCTAWLQHTNTSDADRFQKQVAVDGLFSVDGICWVECTLPDE
jgi:hypothetical protein